MKNLNKLPTELWYIYDIEKGEVWVSQLNNVFWFKKHHASNAWNQHHEMSREKRIKFSEQNQFVTKKVDIMYPSIPPELIDYMK